MAQNFGSFQTPVDHNAVHSSVITNKQKTERRKKTQTWSQYKLCTWWHKISRIFSNAEDEIITPDFYSSVITEINKHTETGTNTNLRKKSWFLFEKSSKFFIERDRWHKISRIFQTPGNHNARYTNSVITEINKQKEREKERKKHRKLGNNTGWGKNPPKFFKPNEIITPVHENSVVVGWLSVAPWWHLPGVLVRWNLIRK
jgi:hypothetical protein